MVAATANVNSMSKVAKNRVVLSGQIRKQIAKYARIDSSIHASFAAMAVSMPASTPSTVLLHSAPKTLS